MGKFRKRQTDAAFLIFPGSWHFMQIVSNEMSNGDSLHEMSKPVFWKKKYRKYSSISSAENLPRVVNVKEECGNSETVFSVSL